MMTQDQRFEADLLVQVDGDTENKLLKARWLQGYQTGKKVQMERIMALLDSLDIYGVETATHQRPFVLRYTELKELIQEDLK